MCTFQLKDKTILVTGIDGFLGSALRRALTVEGANIIGTDIKSSPLTQSLNISDADEVDDFVADLASLDVKLDGIVNNAAVSFKGMNITNDEFATTTKVNIQGTHNCITRFKPLFESNASVVNIASIYGLISPDSRIYEGNEELYNSSVYGATKAAIIQMTKYYATHYADGHVGKNIRVNAVSPGGIWQNHDDEFMARYGEKVPMGRMAQVDEIVQPILFLLSPLSSYVTGHNLVVDGGLSAW